MINTIIIDDELNAIELIRLILSNNFPEIKVLASTQSPIEGIKLINQLKPDLVFLDIEMPEGNGFDILEALPERNFETIFVTAYNKYAIKAFKYSAIDYLLKPIDIDDFINAIKRFIEKRNANRFNSNQYDILFDNIKSKYPFKISVPSSKGIEYIDVEVIIRIEADGRYSTLYTNENRSITVTKLLSELIEIVDSNVFYRPHKSHYVNLNYVKMLARTGGGYIEMKDGSQIPISRNNKDEFTKQMELFINGKLH